MEEKVLIVSSQEKDSERLSKLFVNFGMQALVITFASKARRKILEEDFDYIIVNAPLSDEFGTEFAISVAEKTVAGVLLFVKSDMFTPTVEKAEKYGVFVLEKPLTIPLNEVIRYLRAVSFRLKSMRRENLKLTKRIADMRIIERAKIALIQYKNMTEDEAHKFIERMAMDQRQEKVQVATEILKRYED